MRFEFRPLARSDFDLLARWLAEPVVHRWWQHEFTAEALERDFGSTVDGTEPTATDVVLLAESGTAPIRPIGLIQSYALSDYPDYVEELTAVMVVPPDAGSLDYLIGEADYRGRGVGRAMIAAYVDRAWTLHPLVRSLIVPVVAANVASWMALTRAGFTMLGEGNLEPENPVDEPLHVIMGLDRRPS
ncbi:MAG: acetyltransferase [Acidimicrobiia bacterium]|nr:acetyltransferase [Acidimicrobiia bacterium]